ncbi:hypothetical protein BGZ99_005683 [Dissophora globulifera]|uniref:malate dehydrogenase n=1 Tax=Dissophora globulifera TaxID=979702 RepID=A0A9P6RIE7_9FUNG|nr:hypothetical protein BGZ99_005683 [Dissophora globulifera]
MDDWFDEGDFETARLVCLHEGLDHIEQIVETLHTLREELRAKEAAIFRVLKAKNMILRKAVEQANIEIKPSMQGGSVPVFQNRKNVRLNRCVQLSLLELGVEDASRSLDELATIATNHHLKRELSLARSNMMRNLGHRSIPHPPRKRNSQSPQSDMIAYLDPLYILVASGVVDDLSHIDPKCRVTSYGKDRIDEALKGVHTVVISAGVLRKPGMTRDNLLKV